MRRRILANRTRGTATSASWQADRILDALLLQPLVDLRLGEGCIGAEVEVDATLAIAGDHRLQDEAPIRGAVDVARPEERPLEIAELVEHEQRVVAQPKCPFHAAPSCRPWVGLSELSMSRTMSGGGLRAWIWSIQALCAELGVTTVKGVLSRDHVHMFVAIPPQLAVSELMRRVKGRSSRKIQQEFPAIRKRYWGCHFWARGYFSTTSGNITDDVILQYLEQHIAQPTGVSR